MRILFQDTHTDSIKFVKGRAGISLDSVKNMFTRILGCVSTCIACATDFLGHYVCHPRAYKVTRILVSAQVVAKIRSRCFWNFQDTQTDSQKIVKGRAGISLDCVKNMLTSVLGCVSMCIAYATINFWTLCLPSKGLQGYANLGVYTSGCQNKITVLLEFLKADTQTHRKFVKGPSWNISRLCENMLMSVLGCVSMCIAYAEWNISGRCKQHICGCMGLR